MRSFLFTRICLRLLTIGLALCFAGSAGAATSSAVFVDIRANNNADAPVVERQKLYGASYALVVGIDNYTNGWPRLSNAIKDARLVTEALQKQGFQVDLVLDPDGESLRNELRRFYAIKGRDPEARLFVWYAGHGHTEYGEGYLVPADAPLPDDPDFLLKALHMGDVGSMVKIARAKHSLAVFDSCFAGTVFTAQRARPPAAITKAAVQPVRQFLTSGDADQQVSDDGTFRRLFINSLAGTDAADLNGDGYLTGTELGLHLENRVTNLTKAKQTPRSGKLRDARFDRGDFIFVMPKPEVEQQAAAALKLPEPKPAKDDSAFELTFWQSVKDSENPADYQAYLEAYPDGRFAPLAKVRASSLNQPSRATAKQAADDTAQRLREELAKQKAAQEELRQALEAQQRQQAEVNKQLAQQAQASATSANRSQQARLPETKAQPLKSREEVEAYIDDNEHSVRRMIAAYTKRTKILIAGTSRSEAQINNWSVDRLDGTSVFAKINYSYGHIKGATNMATGTFVFEMEWVDDELEIVSHQKSD